MNLRRINIGLGILIGIMVIAAIVGWIFFRSSATPGLGSTSTNSANFNGGTSDQSTGGGGSAASNTNQPIGTATNNPQQKIFKIADGPVAGAVYLQMGTPTTTIARYVMADSGHVFDLPVDVPGAVARSVSNTTIPGIARAVWAAVAPASSKAPQPPKGSAVLLQYLDNGITKTVSVGFPTMATSSSQATTSAVQAPLQIRFFPDGITSLDASPDGTAAAYLLQSTSGSTGYVANANGTSAQTLFTLPLSEVTLSWPSKSALLVNTKPNADTPGIAFSASTRTGALAQLVYAQGLSAIADAAFSTIIYQTTGSGSRLSYAHSVATGQDRGLSFQPIPEKCAWSPLATSTLFCATPATYVPTNYLDLWHQGLSNVADSIFVFNTQNGASLALASPGSSDGGAAASISQLGVSPDGKYLFYISRTDGSLWGVRL